MMATSKNEFGLGKNIQASLEGNILTLVMDITQEFGLSSSGQSIIVATTGGNTGVSGTDLYLGANLYRRFARTKEEKEMVKDAMLKAHANGTVIQKKPSTDPNFAKKLGKYIPNPKDEK